MAVPDYFQNQGTGKEARDIWNKAYHRANNSAHEWEQGHEGNYCIYDGKLWRFGVDTVGANRNDTPGEIDSESNGSWLPFSDSTVTQQDIDNAIAAVELLPGPVGPQGIAGNAGVAGAQGLKGNTGDQGPAGTDGIIGVDGVQGIQGDAGPQGIQGIKGDTGDTGPQGIQGTAGSTGPQGIQGEVGPQGVAGTDGSDGSGVTIVGSVANAAALNPSYGGSTGEMYITADDGHGHVWNGATWDDVGQIQGPAGADGAAGANGNDGSQGIQGNDGSDGDSAYTIAVSDGFIGDEAAWLLSLKGAAGSNGTDGADGSDGAQGIQGDQGDAGADGASYLTLKQVNGSIATDVALLVADISFSVASHYPDSEYPGSFSNGAATYTTHARDVGTPANDPAENGGSIVYLSATVYAKLSDNGSVLDGYKWGMRGKGEDVSVILQAMLDTALWFSYQTSYTDYPSTHTVKVGGTPVIKIPAGRYAFNSQVALSRAFIEIDSVGALFEPTAAFIALDVKPLDLTNAWQVKISGITWQGFEMATAWTLDLDSSNANIGSILLDRMTFQRCNKAIHHHCQSTETTMTKMRWIDCGKALWNEKGDRVTVNSFWIEDGERTGHQDFAFENGSASNPDPVLSLNDGIMVPKTPHVDATEPCWVKNWSIFKADNCRPGAEPGSQTLINHHGPADAAVNVKHVGFTVTNCQATATWDNGGANYQPAIARLIKWPNYGKITGTTNMFDCNLIDFSVDVADPAALMATQGLDPQWLQDRHLWFEIHGNCKPAYPKAGWVEVNHELHHASIAPHIRDYAGVGGGGGGTDGIDGDSAYEVAVADGFVGDETAWLASLVGATGAQGVAGNDGADSVVAGPQGIQGETGLQGSTGPQGTSGADGSDGSDGVKTISTKTTGAYTATDADSLTYNRIDANVTMHICGVGQVGKEFLFRNIGAGNISIGAVSGVTFTGGTTIAQHEIIIAKCITSDGSTASFYELTGGTTA